MASGMKYLHASPGFASKCNAKPWNLREMLNFVKFSYYVPRCF
jgi:hypothetical protein